MIGASRILDGKAIASQVIADLKLEIAELRKQRGILPSLALMLVGDHPSQEVFVRNKVRACEQVGIRAELVRLGAESTLRDLWAAIEKLNARTDLGGVLVQLPLPRHLPEDRVLPMIDPRKDVEGFHPSNLGRLCLGQPKLVPCATGAILELLRRIGIDPAGRHAVIVGSSYAVGRPTALLLLHHGASVALCQPDNPQLRELTAQADVLIAAAGPPGTIGPSHVKPGAVVIDAAVSRLNNELEVRRAFPGDAEALARFRERGYALAGCVAAQVRELAGALLPVPGGFGSLTIAFLLKNTVQVSAQ
ncbi:MAG TPA: bifunctional 5,10-methylenetetrahydrofolate dehydrogenase/5,10-methenyltetrahydrofolate cyclohydrolase [Acidobacteriota bacterium]